jgi:hypothetical protein
MRERAGSLIGPIKAGVAKKPPPEGVFLSVEEAARLVRRAGRYR